MFHVGVLCVTNSVSFMWKFFNKWSRGVIVEASLFGFMFELGFEVFTIEEVSKGVACSTVLYTYHFMDLDKY